MKKKERIRYIFCFLILLILLAGLLMINVASGSVSLTVGEVFRILLRHEAESTAGHIIWDIRLPRILAAVILGGALAVSGFMLQTFFANPIAGPFVLGISSGAKLTVALAMIFFLGKGWTIGSWTLILSAFIGSMVAMGFVIVIAGKVKNMSILIICGVMIGYICSAITDFVVTFADDSNIVNLHNWSMGSFSGIHWKDVGTMSVVVFVTVGMAFLLSKPMYAYQLGEANAKNAGVHIRLFRVILVLLSSILAACVTAFAGPISFVGVAMPHLAKKLFQTAKPVLMIPASFLLGADFCLFCDLIARTVFAPTEMSISSITAIFGAPIVIGIMLNRKMRGKNG